MKYNDKNQTFQPSAPFALTSAKPESRGSANGALGNATKLPTPPKQPADFIDNSNLEFICPETGEILQQGKINEKLAIDQARSVRFKLQDAARDILFKFHGSKVPVNSKGYEVHHRTCTCTRFRTGFTAQVVKSKTNGKAFFNGLMSCANSRTCPVCSAKISERKANEMRQAFNIAIAEKLNISLLTFTAPHNSGDKLVDLKLGISKALELFWTGATAKRFKEKYGIIGHVRSFEIRHGKNGWHPHFHIIIFSKNELPFTLRDSKRKLKLEQSLEWLKILERWQSCCVRADLNSPNMYGMDIQNGKGASEYISKFGSDDEILATKTGKKITWDMADEMTKGNVKTGRKGSSSPWDLLALSIDGETEQIKNENKILFLFYARAMQGVNLIRWSRGLRKYFDLSKDVSDEEIIKQELDRADLLCHITPEEWSFIIKNKLRDIVLQLAETKPIFDEENLQIDGSYIAVARFLYNKNIGYDSFNDFLTDFKLRDINVDYQDILFVDSDTTPLKTGKDLTFSTVKKENNLIFKRPIFEAIDKKLEFEKEQLFFEEIKDLLDFAQDTRLILNNRKLNGKKILF